MGPKGGGFGPRKFFGSQISRGPYGGWNSEKYPGAVKGALWGRKIQKIPGGLDLFTRILRLGFEAARVHSARSSDPDEKGGNAIGESGRAQPRQ